MNHQFKYSNMACNLMSTLESQGNSFLNGVRFSVQTISLGNDE